jgi:hypothetical protein
VDRHCLDYVTLGCLFPEGHDRLEHHLEGRGVKRLVLFALDLDRSWLNQVSKNPRPGGKPGPGLPGGPPGPPTGPEIICAARSHGATLARMLPPCYRSQPNEHEPARQRGAGIVRNQPLVVQLLSASSG